MDEVEVELLGTLSWSGCLTGRMVGGREVGGREVGGVSSWKSMSMSIIDASGKSDKKSADWSAKDKDATLCSGLSATGMEVDRW